MTQKKNEKNSKEQSDQQWQMQNGRKRETRNNFLARPELGYEVDGNEDDDDDDEKSPIERLK